MDALRKLARLMEVDHCTIHVVSENSTLTYNTKVLTTYPKAWIARYLEKRYYFVDPVTFVSREADGAFYWDVFDASGPLAAPFWADAQAHGVGPSGYSIPIDTERGDRLLVSVSSTAAPEVFREKFERNTSDLHQFASFLTEAFCRLATEDRPSSFNPTDDQLTVLHAIAAGVSEQELELWDHLPFAAVRQSICELFRTRTLAHAAVLSAKLGLLDRAPFSKADILAAAEETASGRVIAMPKAAARRRRARLESELPAEDCSIRAIGGLAG